MISSLLEIHDLVEVTFWGIRLQLCIFLLLSLHLLFHNEGVDLVVVVFSLSLLDLVLSMKALVEDCFEFRVNSKVIKHCISISLDSGLIVGENLNQDFGVVV